MYHRRPAPPLTRTAYPCRKQKFNPIPSENGNLCYYSDYPEVEEEKMEFREIDRTNYWDCMALTIDESQYGFVADNKQSLVEAAYEDGLYPLGIYHGETMVGFLLYDYDDTIPGWSLSRFMIGKRFQGNGYGKQAAAAFLDYFKNKHNAGQLYISVSRKNTTARKMFASLGFKEIKEVEYTFSGMQFREMQMVKRL